MHEAAKFMPQRPQWQAWLHSVGRHSRPTSSMRILDRYVLAAFLKNYVISTVVLVGFYVLLDMIFGLDNFTGFAGQLPVWRIVLGVVEYYFYESFFTYAQLAGVIPVLAAAFTFMRMSRFNELTALLAAGVPLLRVALPVVIAALAINLVLQPVNQELLIPSFAEKITRKQADVFDEAGRAKAVRSMPDGAGGIFDAARYHPAEGQTPPWVESLTVVERDADGDVGRLIIAKRADWDASAQFWKLTDGRVVTDLAIGASPNALPRLGLDSPELRSGSVGTLKTLQTVITPEEIELFHSADIGVGAGGSYFDLLSTRQMNELLARPRHYSPAGLLRAKHSRLSAHVMNIILMLLAIPAVLTREPGRLRRAAGRTLLLVGAAMGTVFLCQLWAENPPTPDLAARWPVWMAWAPVLVFGPLSIALMDRLES